MLTLAEFEKKLLARNIKNLSCEYNKKVFTTNGEKIYYIVKFDINNEHKEFGFERIYDNNEEKWSFKYGIYDDEFMNFLVNSVQEILKYFYVSETNKKTVKTLQEFEKELDSRGIKNLSCEFLNRKYLLNIGHVDTYSIKFTETNFYEFNFEKIYKHGTVSFKFPEVSPYSPKAFILGRINEVLEYFGPKSCSFRKFIDDDKVQKITTEFPFVESDNAKLPSSNDINELYEKWEKTNEFEKKMDDFETRLKKVNNKLIKLTRMTNELISQRKLELDEEIKDIEQTYKNKLSYSEKDNTISRKRKYLETYEQIPKKKQKII